MSFRIRQDNTSTVKDLPKEQLSIEVPVLDKENHKIGLTHELVNYATVGEKYNIIKLGYCCEPEGNIYPIYLKIKGQYEEFQVGQTGMFEFQQEIIESLTENEEEETTDVVITGVKVPTDIDFTLEYAY